MIDFSLCTYSSGRVMAGEVLGDWRRFLPSRPRAVAVAVPGDPQLLPIYEQLRTDGVIDRLVVIDPASLSPHQVLMKGIRASVEAAESEWVVLVMLDALPYRRGHDDWLDGAVRAADAHGYFGLTGSFRSADLQPGPNGFCRTRKSSNNFSVFRRSAWLALIDEHFQLGPGPDARIFGVPQSGKAISHAFELIVQHHLQTTGTFNLYRPETPDWTVFHVNQWGENLRRLRSEYFARRDIERFMNIGEPLDPDGPRPGWERYYGYARPPLWQRARAGMGARLRKLAARATGDDR